MSHAYISLISCLLPLVISTDLLKLPLELIPTLVYGNLVGWDGIFKYPLIAKNVAEPSIYGSWNVIFNQWWMVTFSVHIINTWNENFIFTSPIDRFKSGWGLGAKDLA